MEITLWSKVGVDVQSAIAAATTITAITKANPGVVTSVAHGYLDGDLLLLKIAGMGQLDYRVVRVDNKTADTYELEGINTTNFDTFTSGTAEKLTMGTTASTFQDINASGGEAEASVIKTIHNDQDFVKYGNFSPMEFSFGSIWDIADPALLALNAFGALKTECAIAFRFSGNQKVYFAATPSASLAPVGSAGAPVTTPVKLGLRGRLTFYAS